MRTSKAWLLAPLIAAGLTLAACSSGQTPTEEAQAGPCSVTDPDSLPELTQADLEQTGELNFRACEGGQDTDVTITEEWFPLIATDGVDLPTQVTLSSDVQTPADCALTAEQVLVLELNGTLYRARSVACNQNSS